MRRAEIEGLAQRWTAAWRDGSPERFDEVEAPDFCDGSAAGQDAGNAGLRATVAALHRAFAALEITADLVTADAALGLATIRWTASGRHIRPFLGIAPSGGRVSFHGIEVIRCQDGRVAERWGEWDEAGILTLSAGFPLAAE